MNYTFTTSTTDPDNDPLLYEFDWGDGSTSGWVGPFASGSPGSASHVWTSGNIFNVSVRAKDTIGAITEWSGSTSITIGAPILQVQKIRGGLHVKIALLNVGDGNAKVTWRITIFGSFGGGITFQHSGHIDSLPVNEPVTLTPFTSGVFGFGKITLRVEASAVYGNNLLEDTQGFLFGPIAFIHK